VELWAAAAAGGTVGKKLPADYRLWSAANGVAPYVPLAQETTEECVGRPLLDCGDVVVDVPVLARRLLRIIQRADASDAAHAAADAADATAAAVEDQLQLQQVIVGEGVAPPDEETRSNHADAGEDDDRYEGGVGSGAAGRDLRNTLDRTSAVTTVASGAIYSLEVLRPLPSEVFEGTVIAANLSYEVPGDWLICVTYDDDSSRATSSSSSFSSPTSSLSRPECGLPGSPLSPWQHTFPKRHSDELAEGAHRFAAWFHRPPHVPHPPTPHELRLGPSERTEQLLRVEVPFFSSRQSTRHDHPKQHQKVLQKHNDEQQHQQHQQHQQDQQHQLAPFGGGGSFSLRVLRPAPSESFAGAIIPSLLSFEVPSGWLLCISYDVTRPSSSSSSSLSSSSQCGYPGRHVFRDVHSDELEPGGHTFAAWFQFPMEKTLPPAVPPPEQFRQFQRVEVQYSTKRVD
jgi:hypothetical protein